MKRWHWVPAVSTVCAVALTSCAQIKIDNLPQLGSEYRDGYNIVIEFDNVLNLPDRAKIVKDGTTVGVVEHVDVVRGAANVTARIAPSVKVPTDVHAVLQQATVLGDIYVALSQPPDGAADSPALSTDGRIPLAQTTSPPPLEDTLANLATFVGSGSIQRIQDSVIGINRVTPERRDELHAIVSRVSTDLAEISDHIDTTDQWLNGVAQTAQVLSDRTPQLSHWLTPEGFRGFERVSISLQYVSTLLPSLGSIYSGGYWLTPLLDSLGNAMGAVQKSKWAIEGEYRPWRELFTDTFLPADKYPAMNITSIQTPDGREISGNVQDVLRMLGAIP